MSNCYNVYIVNNNNISNISILLGERGDQEQGEKRRGEEDKEGQADRQLLLTVIIYTM